ALLKHELVQRSQAVAVQEHHLRGDQLASWEVLRSPRYTCIMEGVGPKSWKILTDLGALLKQIDLPFIACGDFQMLPSTLQESGWVDALDAGCVAPAGAACTNSSQGAARCIDFFVISRVLHQGATAQVLFDGGTAPHFPVLLRVPTRMAADLDYMVTKVPKRLPLDIPVGCRRKDPSVLWPTFDQHAAGMDQVALLAGLPSGTGLTST
ncbi:unnamed protein product, partial [Prorocentrum cordatum]